MVENAFEILKHSFRELLDTIDLYVTFVPDVVVCCCLLHNLLLGQESDEVARLLEVLQRDGVLPEVDSDPVQDPAQEAQPTMEFGRADEKRTHLGVFLGRHRQLEM